MLETGFINNLSDRTQYIHFNNRVKKKIHSITKNITFDTNFSQKTHHHHYLTNHPSPHQQKPTKRILSTIILLDKIVEASLSVGPVTRAPFTSPRSFHKVVLCQPAMNTPVDHLIGVEAFWLVISDPTTTTCRSLLKNSHRHCWGVWPFFIARIRQSVKVSS